MERLDVGGRRLEGVWLQPRARFRATRLTSESRCQALFGATKKVCGVWVNSHRTEVLFRSTRPHAEALRANILHPILLFWENEGRDSIFRRIVPLMNV